MKLAPFPVDDQTLDLLEQAINIDPAAERSSLFDLLDMYSRLGGSDTRAVAETLEDGIVVMRDPQYSPHDVIAALVGEVRRLRAGGGERG